jgi:hypothetical protein
VSENNLLSFTGPYSDIGTKELGNVDGSGGTPPYSDAVHFSYATGWTVHADSIIGGKEDCIDINNRSMAVNVSVNKLYSNGEYVCTIKGGSRGITISGTIYAHGKTVDVDLGNWSDQSHDVTRGVILDLVTVDGSPVTYRVLNADKPTFAPGSGPYQSTFVLPPWLVGPVWWVWGILKHLGLA